LPYPGGPGWDRLAREGNSRAIDSLAKLSGDSLDVSMSGLKTAVKLLVEGNETYSRRAGARHRGIRGARS
jgi:tRNA A37 threonylcarbamoyltransferase TsaD